LGIKAFFNDLIIKNEEKLGRGMWMKGRGKMGRGKMIWRKRGS